MHTHTHAHMRTRSRIDRNTDRQMYKSQKSKVNLLVLRVLGGGKVDLNSFKNNGAAAKLRST